jgi:hypothetical protein
MARTPRSKVPKSSGQGISRLSYQKARDIRTSPDAPQAEVKFSKAESSGDRYAKKPPKRGEEAGMNVSYGSTLFPSDLGDIRDYGSGKIPQPAVKLSPTRGKKAK